MRPVHVLLFSLALLAGCAVPESRTRTLSDPQEIAAARAADNFVAVVERVGPVAEQVCREEGRGRRCDFQIFVDDRPGSRSNAYFGEDRRGRPTIIFTLPLIADLRNKDEVAFVLSHEAAHHISGHVDRATASAQLGALVLGNLAAAYGYDRAGVEAAAAIGAEVGFRQYSRQFELEADALGTRIALRAGFDPVKGSAYFERIPDPGDEFLGTHPPNSERQALVQRTADAAGG